MHHAVITLHGPATSLDAATARLVDDGACVLRSTAKTRELVIASDQSMDDDLREMTQADPELRIVTDGFQLLGAKREGRSWRRGRSRKAPDGRSAAEAIGFAAHLDWDDGAYGEYGAYRRPARSGRKLPPAALDAAAHVALGEARSSEPAAGGAASLLLARRVGILGSVLEDLDGVGSRSPETVHAVIDTAALTLDLGARAASRHPATVDFERAWLVTCARHHATRTTTHRPFDRFDDTALLTDVLAAVASDLDEALGTLRLEVLRREPISSWPELEGWSGRRRHLAAGCQGTLACCLQAIVLLGILEVPGAAQAAE